MDIDYESLDTMEGSILINRVKIVMCDEHDSEDIDDITIEIQKIGKMV